MATIPSIAMIPSGVKASKLYSVLPTDGTGDFTTTRASVATRVNENGLIEEVAANVPRLDYSDGTCPSLLLEPSSTNLLVQSQVFSGYGGSNQIVTDNSIISPDGTVTGAILADSGLGGIAGVQVSESVTVDVSSTYTYSVFAKKKDIDFIALRTSNFATVPSGQSYFDLNLGTTLGVAAGHTSKIENYGNGWYRCSITFTTDAVDTAGTIIARLSQDGTTSTVDLDNTSNIYIWGFQFEKNSYATSYIKTIGTTQTRVADTASGSGNSTVINSSEGTIYVEGSWLDSNLTSLTRIVNILGVDGAVQIRSGSATNRIQAVATSGGVTQTLVTTAFDVTTNLKIALKYKLNDFALWVNGTEIATDLSGIAPVGLNELRIENHTKTKSVQLYTTALSDAELTTLTTI